VSQLDYVVDLTSRYMSFKEQAVVARSDTEKFNGLLAQWRSEQPKMRPISDETRGRLKQDMVDAAQIINEHWAALTRLENEYARNWINLSGRLYTPFAVQRDVVVADPIINERVIVTAVCFAILLFFALWGLRSMLHLIKHNRD
jgi:hypothetical protein